MKVIEKLLKADKVLFSFEIIPPLKGKNIKHIYAEIEPLLEFNPAFVNVTYHREEYVFKERERGLLEKISIRKRPGTVGICSAIMHKYGIDPVAHIICGGFSKEETEDALLDLHYVGISNVLVVRGDPIKTEPFFRPHPRGHKYACDLLSQIVNLNRGIYNDDEMVDSEATDFCIGVAGYPEKHYEAPNMATDLKYLKQKVDLGTDYIITQMVFDNHKYFEFVKTCRELGIKVPIIPGIKPLNSLNQVRSFPQLFHLDLPSELIKEVEHCKTNEDVEIVGREWAIEQCRELIEFGVPGLHFYTMSKAGPTRNVLMEIF